MQHFFCNIYPRPAQYFQNCRFHLLLKCIRPTHVYGILTFKRDITQLYSENLLKMPKCVFFSKFLYLPFDILSECFILLLLLHTLPMFILNINTFPGAIWLVNRILCHFMQFLPPSSSIFSHVNWPHFALVPNSCLSAITLWYLNLISCKCFHKNVEKAQKYEF